MEEAQTLCAANQYQYLFIPKARVCGEFLLEERLPITAIGYKQQLGEYLSHLDDYTDAIKEFAGFLCQSTLTDITGNTKDPYNSLSRVPMGRYDNVMLFEGKLGLVDLETFALRELDNYNGQCLTACKQLTRLFPYHLEEIIDAVSAFDDQVIIYQKQLEEEKLGALKRIKIAYEDHLEFIENKQITLDNFSDLFIVDDQRRREIETLVLSKMSQRVKKEPFFKSNPEEVLKLYGASISTFFQAAHIIISDALAHNIGNLDAEITSIPKLLDVRTLRFKMGDKIFSRFEDSIEDDIEAMGLDHWEAYDLECLTLKWIFQELVRGGEIAYYNPKFGYGGHATHCIFC